jgi:hypothetical protein
LPDGRQLHANPLHQVDQDSIQHPDKADLWFAEMTRLLILVAEYFVMEETVRRK